MLRLWFMYLLIDGIIFGFQSHHMEKKNPAFATSSSSTKKILWQKSIFADTVPHPRTDLTQGQ